MGDSELCYLSAEEALGLFKERKLSPVELMEAVIRRAEAVEPKINAFTATHFERALSQAKKAEDRYLRPSARTRALEGLPIVVKDEQAIAGERTTQGSLLYRDHVDAADHPIVERIKRAGGIIHARGATPEFCCSTFCWSRLWGVTRNPWNLEYSPGGSSGGSAASLAAGSTPLATGSDIGGSIRIPASACGVVGFKPPYGRNPDVPPFNLDWYNHVGPLARNVADCARLQNVMAGPHPGDVATLRPKLRIPAKLGDVRGWRIAYSLNLDFFEVDAEVRANTLAVLDAFRELGATTEEIELGWGEEIREAAWSHYAAIFGPIVQEAAEKYPDQLSDYSLVFAERTARAASASRGLHSTLETEARMYASLGPLLEKYRLLVCPTLAVPSVAADHDVRDESFSINGVPVDPYVDWCLTYPFNMLSRCPVLSVPSGQASSGVPTGVQLVGRTFDDVSVFRAGAALEGLRPRFDVPESRPSFRRS